MERRNFLRTMLGVAAATALPSEVWPFRKIFLPAQPSIVEVLSAEVEAAMSGFRSGVDSYVYGFGSVWLNLPRATYPGKLSAFRIENIEEPEPLIWTANEEQTAAFRRRFKEYGLG